MEKFLRNRVALLLFIVPSLLIYVALLLVPTLWSVVYTFFHGSPITGWSFAGVSNYIHLFHDPDFLSSLWISTKYAAVVTSGQVILGFLVSVMYLLYIRRFSTLIRTLLFFPVVLPTVAVSQMFQKLFALTPFPGLINGLLGALHLQALEQAWLGQGNTAFWVLCTMDIWRSIGFYAVLLYAGLIDIPGDVLEAAMLDGARGWRFIRFIILPLLRPILFSAVIFSLNGTLKVFDTPVALTNGGPGNATTTLAVYMFNTAFSYGQYGYGSTIAVFILLFSLVVTLLFYRFARSDIA